MTDKTQFEYDLVEFEDLFSVLIPKNWEYDVNDEEGIVGFSDFEKGYGIMECSFIKRVDSKEPLTGEEVIDHAVFFAKDLGVDLKAEDIKVYEQEGSLVSIFETTLYDEEGKEYSWKVWHIVGTDKVGAITYVCESEDWGKEDLIVEEIVKSFKWAAV